MGQVGLAPGQVFWPRVGLMQEKPSSPLDALSWEAVYVVRRVLDSESGDLGSSLGCHFQLRDLELASPFASV